MNLGFDYITEDFTAILGILGYYAIDTSYRGFYSQGDGASFTARYSYGRHCTKNIIAYAPKDEELHAIARALTELQKKCRFDFVAKIVRMPSIYVHENTMTIGWVESPNNRVTDTRLAEQEEHFLTISRCLAKWYYKQLNKEYEDGSID